MKVQDLDPHNVVDIFHNSVDNELLGLLGCHIAGAFEEDTGRALTKAMLFTEPVAVVTAGSCGKSSSSMVKDEAKREVDKYQYVAFPLNEPDVSQAIASCTETVVESCAVTSL